MLDGQELTVLELIRTVRHLQEQVEALTGETVSIRLPGPGAERLVSFGRFHPNSGYGVQIEVAPHCREGVDRVDILERRRNGLRLSYRGSAPYADLILWIQDRPQPQCGQEE